MASCGIQKWLDNTLKLDLRFRKDKVHWAQLRIARFHLLHYEMSAPWNTLLVGWNTSGIVTVPTDMVLPNRKVAT